MVTFSDSEVRAYEQRLAAKKAPAEDKLTEGVEKEGDLHAEITKECARRGWLPFHGSMAHKTFRTPGEPDYLIMMDGGGWLAVECKKKDGKVSTDQRDVIAWAAKLGHTIHVVRSFAEFLRLL